MIENNKTNLENLDAKLKRVKAESETMKQAKDSLEKEYDNYKVFRNTLRTNNDLN